MTGAEDEQEVAALLRVASAIEARDVPYLSGHYLSGYHDAVELIRAYAAEIAAASSSERP